MWNITNKLNKQKRGTLIAGKHVTASWGGMRWGGGIEQKGKRIHKHGQQYGDC